MPSGLQQHASTQLMINLVDTRPRDVTLLDRD